MKRQQKLYNRLLLSLALIALTAFPMCGLHLSRTSYFTEDQQKHDDDDGYIMFSEMDDIDSMQVAENVSMQRLREIMEVERQKTPRQAYVVQKKKPSTVNRVGNTLVDAQHTKLSTVKMDDVSAIAVRKKPVKGKRQYKRPPVLEFAPLYKKAVDLYYSQHYVEAIETFRTLLEFNSAHPLANQCQHWIGEAYFAMGAFYAAVVEYEKVALFPHAVKSAEARLMIGIALFRVGENNLAEQELEGILASNEKMSVQITAQRYLRKISQA
ncbi:MAG: hypothetical protein DWQ10_04015 [Calditrichaeota bacterium]|nr:MAG: hypothetical protein DWQ10_04015 [Calditrichota bacterium]